MPPPKNTLDSSLGLSAFKRPGRMPKGLQRKLPCPPPSPSAQGYAATFGRPKKRRPVRRPGRSGGRGGRCPPLDVGPHERCSLDDGAVSGKEAEHPQNEFRADGEDPSKTEGFGFGKPDPSPREAVHRQGNSTVFVSVSVRNTRIIVVSGCPG